MSRKLCRVDDAAARRTYRGDVSLPSRDDPTVPCGLRVAAALLALQVVGLLFAVVYYIVQGLQGLGQDRTQVAMSVVLFLVGVAGLLAVARGLLRAARWARTPALVWNALLVPIAWNLMEGGQPAWALALAVVGLAGLGSLVFGSRATRE